jgi:hypothetical protein
MVDICHSPDTGLIDQKISKQDRAAFISFVVLFFFAMFLFLAQEQESTKALLEGEDIFVSNSFYGYQPDFKTTFIPKRILDISHMRENIIADGNKFTTHAGTIETKPFPPSRYMSIPLLGGAFDEVFSGRYDPKRASIVLKCLDTDAAVDLLQAPSEGWGTRIIRIPDNWCPGLVKIAATSKQDQIHIGIGTPVKVGPLLWLVSSRIGVVAAGIFASGLFCLLFIPVLLMQSISLNKRLLFTILYPSVGGYFLYMFAQTPLQHHFLRTFGVIFFALPSFLLFVQRKKGNRSLDLNVARLFCLGLAGCFTIILLPYLLTPLENGFWFPNYAFYPSIWSTDNLLSVMMAKYALISGSGHPDFLGTWSISDRGIVQAGTYTGLFGLLSVLHLFDNTAAIPVIYHFFASFLQGLIIPIGVIFFKNYLNKDVSAWKLTALISTTPFIMLNSFYTWPKLYAGLLIIAAVIALLTAQANKSAKTFCLAIICFVFAILNHSANNIMIISFIYFILALLATNKYKISDISKIVNTNKTLVFSTLVICFLLIKAVSWLEHPSSWPITFLITGTGTFGLGGYGILDQAKTYYSQMTLEHWLAIKTKLLDDLVWIKEQFFARRLPHASVLTTIRTHEFFSLVPALGPGLLASFLISIGCKCLPNTNLGAGPTANTETLQAIMTFAGACILTILTMVLLFNMPMVVHHLPYGAVLGIMFALVCFAVQRPFLLNTALIISVLNYAIVWLYGAWITWNIDIYK